jgi:hydroxymethylbilane synthase
VTEWVPAVGQGIIGVEVRADDEATRRWVAALDHPPTRVCALAERAFLRELGASCATAMAGHATLDGGRLAMTGVVVSDDGRRLLRAEAVGRPEEAEALGRGLAACLLARGAATVTVLHPGRVAS